MIFAAHQIRATRREQNHEFYAVFVDITKAFNSSQQRSMDGAAKDHLQGQVIKYSTLIS